MANYDMVIIWVLCIQIVAGLYTIHEEFEPSTFFESFDFFTAEDPTHGFVDYVDKEEARSGGLIAQGNSSVYIGVDHVNRALGRGRKSVRIATKKEYNQMLVVLDLLHMPGEACGSWPAFWMVGSDWPENGEVDIIEGVNRQAENRMALHSNWQCMIDIRGYSGTAVTQNCFISAPDQPANAGCGISGPEGSFGAQFNRQNGGVYAMEWDDEDVLIWFFPRDGIPSDIVSRKKLDPREWGVPTARFHGGDCHVSSLLGPQRLVFDTTFCGDWADSDWGSSSCGRLRPRCTDYVATEPGAFRDEYWEIDSLRIYSKDRPPTTATTTFHVSCSGRATH
ncbi:concanavalin A-like lectin/glucanase domain-containing protein [Penicillium capsulatum]|uniref:endo-1,3(4)-beta-glucanase n=1 Tax=Penicillium capsulatum TaxID=69766 RepID=A0A9W9HTH3_9EURO|nr:concanavalin A-like lectin/glucanase domain-containing protein [Penicillium capsulatum]KAJ6105851.1 concanavalin A-like lectin/glucanase domain-containing protein [Penicillium capsulatum]